MSTHSTSPIEMSHSQWIDQESGESDAALSNAEHIGSLRCEAELTTIDLDTDQWNGEHSTCVARSTQPQHTDPLPVQLSMTCSQKLRGEESISEGDKLMLMSPADISTKSA